jgi:hypothetical protein
MRALLLSIFLLSIPVEAQVLNKCLEVYKAAGVTTSGNSSIVPFPPLDSEAKKATTFTGVIVATNNSGTTPTLDVTLQSCKDTTTASCLNTPITFTQCTTGTCREYIDLSTDLVNVFPQFRAVRTLGGTSPNYDITVELCYN